MKVPFQPATTTLGYFFIKDLRYCFTSFLLNSVWKKKMGWKHTFCRLQTISEIGSGQFADFSNVQYINISGMVTSMDPSSGTITYRPQIQYKFSCLYPMQYLLNNTALGVWVLRRSMTSDCRGPLPTSPKTCVDFSSTQVRGEPRH